MTNPVLDIGDLVISFNDDEIVHFHFKVSEQPVEIMTLKLALSVLKENVTDKVCLLVTTDEGATLTQEARDFASSTEFDEVVKADAIVRTNYSHEMAANFFIRFNRPNRPVKLFRNKEQALEWIAEINKESN